METVYRCCGACHKYGIQSVVDQIEDDLNRSKIYINLINGQKQQILYYRSLEISNNS